MTDELLVRHGSQLVGRLVGGAALTFFPDSVLLTRAPGRPRLSLGFNLTDGANRSDRLQGFFANLLPEGPPLSRIARSSGVSEHNLMTLLARFGGDCQGALAFSDPAAPTVDVAGNRPLSEDEFRNLVAALPEHPLVNGVEDVRLSLPGENLNLPVALDDGRIALPIGGARSSHVAKIARPDMREFVMNEAFCSALARALGLPVATAEVRSGPATILLCERVDRIATAAGIEVVQMEDLCQLSGRPPNAKFYREGGADLVECFALVRRFSAVPATDMLALLDWSMFNFFIGNGHGHAKNLAILHRPQGPRLAPFFALKSTHVYSALNQRMAMPIDGEERPDWLLPERWRGLAAAVRIKPGLVMGRLAAMAEQLPSLAAETGETFQAHCGYASIVREIRRIIEQRVRQVLVALAAEVRESPPAVGAIRPLEAITDASLEPQDE